MVNLTETYVALGANLGDAIGTLQTAAKEIAAHPLTHKLSLSNFYLTSPVSAIPQDPYINAVCRISTSMALLDFFAFLQLIERKFGKNSSDKSPLCPLSLNSTQAAPRALDLDLLFFGTQSYESAHLILPHFDWKNRLFVLRPLQDLTDEIQLPHCPIKGCSELINLKTYLQSFSNPYCETIIAIN